MKMAPEPSQDCGDHVTAKSVVISPRDVQLDAECSYP